MGDDKARELRWGSEKKMLAAYDTGFADGVSGKPSAVGKVEERYKKGYTNGFTRGQQIKRHPDLD